MSSPDDTSSLGKDYDDGVYEKEVEAKSSQSSRYTPSRAPTEQPPKLPTIMLACLIMLLVSCFVGILLSGLHFGNAVHSGDCLGQSWVMFSSLLGLLYLFLHLQAARKGEPMIRKQPCSMNPLHSATIVVARLDSIAWAVALIIVSVAVSKDPSPLSCVNLVACTAITPTIIFILCVDEKATRPFDLPYLTPPPSSSSSSVVTCRVSDFMRAMPDSEVTVEDSISRRGSNHSASSQSPRHSRPNSHTEHAAAIAAANSAAIGGGIGGGISGPRPPPKNSSPIGAKEARSWGSVLSGFDKKDPAAAEAAAPARVGGPRALALSDKARQTGVLPPPVCLEPKFGRPQGSDNKENVSASAAAAATAAAEKSLPSPPTGNLPGGWRKDWGNLAAETGYHSASTTPASTPNINYSASAPSLGSVGSATRLTSRSLSPVAEVDDRRYSAASRTAAAASKRAALPSYPSPHSPTTIMTTTSGASHARYVTTPTAPPRSQQSSSSSSSSSSSPSSSPPSSSAYTYATTAPPRLQHSYSYDAARSATRPPPPVAATATAPARMRLVRAQEALRVRGGARDTVVLLNRPRRLTGDKRPVGDQRSVVSAPAAGRPESRRMPGSFEVE